jgi:hypothetical protein
VLAAGLSPDGKTLAVGGTDGLIRLFDLAAANERGHLEGHRGPVVSVAFGPDGALLASASGGVSIATRPATAADRTGATAPAPTGKRSRVTTPPPADPEKLWADLAGGLRAALAAQRVLGADPATAIALLQDRLAGAAAARPDPAPPEALRIQRAVDLLARIGSPAARELLTALAGGAPEAVATAAAAALARSSPQSR